MAKYRYKQYLNRALWNSILAVLSALVAVLIAVFLWQEISSVITSVMTDKGSEEAVDQSDMELLESLRNGDAAPDEESSRLLDGLRGSETDEASEEEMRQLESLRSS